MSASGPVENLVAEVDALVAAIMADAPMAEVKSIVDRLGAAVARWDEIPPAAIAELHSAIDLAYGGKSVCHDQRAAGGSLRAQHAPELI
jgi:hypothetical protein